MIFLWGKDVFVGRTDDATALEVEFLYTMCCPTNDTCHSKDWSINLLWESYHLIDETAIEVEVGTHWFLRLAELRHTLDSFFFEQTKEIVFLGASLLFGEFSSESL